jgi:hypothetical protein
MEFAYRMYSQVSVESVESLDVFVKTGYRHPESVRHRCQGEAIQTDLISDRACLDHHSFSGQTCPRHLDSLHPNNARL